MTTIKTTMKISVMILCSSMLLSSCCIFRALKRDGASGPDSFSYKKGETDILPKSDAPFRFCRADHNDATLDTLKFFTQRSAGIKNPVTLTRAIEHKSDLQGVMVVRNDSIIYEKCFGDFTPDLPCLVFSVSKSITSILCGIAVDEGIIRSIDNPVTDYIPELLKKDKRWQRLTVRHLLDMRAGFDADDTYSLSLSNLGRLNRMARLEYSHNLMKVLKGLKFKCEPGTLHEYNSFTTAVLGVVIERASGMPYADYLNQKLWSKLGMETDGYVMIDSKRHRHGYGFGGIVTTMTDLAKIGRLYLNKGMWNGKRIVSEQWVRLSTEYNEDNDGYHFCWYNLSCVGADKSEHPGFYAHGIRGQILYVNPDKNIIMVRMGRQDNTYAFIPFMFEQYCNLK